MLAAALMFCTAAAAKDTAPRSGPEAGGRTYFQNYKDMVLAECVSTAYQSDPKVVMDAGSSAWALRDWTSFDWEEHPYPEVTELVERTLARDYTNPLPSRKSKACASTCSSAWISTMARSWTPWPGVSC
ncbi:Uncharacterised protein [Bordetella ansorpii]|uniref:Uncharacterized protein n=1 Tax=Bordetella ansorpii TaxID=288768 RepID=A0A157MSP4_9BORD|nr:Uncharacterised protein [Bordetella ansorpii]